MVIKGNPGDIKGRSSAALFIVPCLCFAFYLLGTWQKSGTGKGDFIAQSVTKSSEECGSIPNIEFETHHGIKYYNTSMFEVRFFRPCDERYVDYTPCHDQERAMTFPRENMNYRERHCPVQEEKLHCLVPAPKGCNMEDILLEIDRIIRPEGAVIFRDHADVLSFVKLTVAGMRWNFKMFDHEDGPLVPEKILVAVKQYRVLGGKNS